MTETTLPVKLLSLATAVPRHSIHQDDVQRRISKVFREDPEAANRLTPVFANAGIDTRYFCVPLDWFEDDHGWAEKNTLFLDHALDLLEEAARRSLDEAGIDAGDIDGIVAVSTSGIATPSLDARLMTRLDFRRDVWRLPVFGLGCAGGVLGLGRAAAFARSTPGSKILLLVVELCGLTFRRNDRSSSNIVATALFGDGAAAAILSTKGEGPAIVASGEHTWEMSLDVMGWGVADDGLEVIFSREIPDLIRNRFRDATDYFLAGTTYCLDDIQTFLCHPGGAKVVDAIGAALGVTEHDLRHSRSVLRDYGNMSAVTVLFVIDRALKQGAFVRPALASAVGPGFTAGFVLFEDR
jgi:alkylresorcinol/alkylpyrone synthase